jgi:arsenite methyltransferase
MNLKRVFLTGLARQLGHPRGVRGRLVAQRLNKANLDTITAAVAALEVAPGEVAADVGFGGGLGLALLLERAGETGQVHGVDVSDLALSRAARRHRAAVTSGRLFLHPASMTALPLSAGSVDAIMTVNTIYFVQDLNRAFAEFARVLSGAGRIVVGIGDPVAMARVPFVQYGFTVRPVSDVLQAMESAGRTVTAHDRVRDGDDAFHLLIARTG